MVFSSWNFFPNNVTKSRRVAKAYRRIGRACQRNRRHFRPKDGSPATDPMTLTRLTYPISITVAQDSRDSNPRIFGIMHRKRGLLLLAVLLQQVEHTGPASAVIFARDRLIAETAVRHFHVSARIGF